MNVLVVAIISGVLALAFAWVKSAMINSKDAGTAKMQEIAKHIAEGAMAFLSREYKVLAVFVAVVALILAVVYRDSDSSSSYVALSFLVGAVTSALAGFFGMKVATRANVRTTHAARTSLSKALGIAFDGGAVMGMCVVGLGIIGLSGLFIFYANIFGLNFESSSAVTLSKVLTVLTGFSLGASSIALFARVGGGIYTKAADVGADLVGKVEIGIPEDDPRNPAVIADNVGDNVGDVAGMGADLFESYVGAMIGSMVLGAVFGIQYVMLPLALGATGILFSIIGTFFVRSTEGGHPQSALNRGTIVAGLGTLVASWFVIHKILEQSQGSESPSANGIFIATVVGLMAGALIGFITEYYTSESRGPVHAIARDSLTGAATNIISGLGLGMYSTALPIIVLSAAILLSFNAAGLYGIALAAIGMLATLGIQLAVDAYGPIADNAGGIAEMSGLPKKVRERTDKLDAVGNTTAAIGKGFAIGSAALTALVLFAAFTKQAQIESIDLLDPRVLAGVFVGAMLPYLFSSMAILAVGKAAGEMIEEVRRQFRTIPGLMEGTAQADYARCVDISTTAAIKKMILPSVLAIGAPVIFGLWDKVMLGGLLVGTTVSGVLLALFMANSGSAWDNAKKHVENGGFKDSKGKPYKKGSDVHIATVVGDTVGDPLKDTAGPSLNILIKLMGVVSLVIAPLIR